MDKSNLGNRMKSYENVYRNYLIPRMPVIVRVDGKAFSTFTKSCEKPFDAGFIDAMRDSAFVLAKEIQGFKFGYIQSDEASFVLTDYDTFETQGWFGYNINKMVSVSASIMTANFNYYFNKYKPSNTKMAYFDSRAFNVPREDVINAIYWRAKDWERNSISMYCSNFYSHKQMYKKNREDMHEMLHSIGKNWTTNLSDREKNGTFIYKDTTSINSLSVRNDIHPEYLQISSNFESLLYPTQI